MRNLLLTRLAKSDLAEIWEYIAHENRVAAGRLMGKIDNAMNQIAKTPSLGFSVEHVRPGIYCKPVKRNYLIFYEVNDDRICILRILHAARNHDDLL